MRKMAVILPVIFGLLLWTLSVPAQQQPMPSRSAKYESIQLGEVVWELGQPSGGKTPVTWKVEVTNTDAKDHTADLQVKFLDTKGAEVFHDSVMRNKFPAKGTYTVGNTATVDAAKAESIKSTQIMIRARN